MNSLAVYYLDTKSLDQHKPRCTVSTASFTRDRFFFPLALTLTLQVLASSCLPHQIFNHPGLLWNVHCVATVVLRKQLKFKARLKDSKDILVLDCEQSLSFPSVFLELYCLAPFPPRFFPQFA